MPSFGQILRSSSHRGTATFDGVLELAESARGDDPRGDRKEFLARFPQVEFVDVAGAGHMVAGDRNDIFADAILGFLARHSA